MLNHTARTVNCHSEQSHAYTACRLLRKSYSSEKEHSYTNVICNQLKM